MKKTILTLILFLAANIIGYSQEYKITKHAVGTGGFVSKTIPSGGKMSGLFGQTITGKVTPTINGEKHTMYLGFWTPVKPTGISEEQIQQRGIYNYPNPVTNFTDFHFELSEPAFVTIRVFNTLGELVTVVTNNEMRSEGINTIPWDVRTSNAGILSAGTYQYEMMVIPATMLSKAKPVSYRNIMIISK